MVQFLEFLEFALGPEDLNIFRNDLCPDWYFHLIGIEQSRPLKFLIEDFDQRSLILDTHSVNTGTSLKDVLEKQNLNGISDVCEWVFTKARPRLSIERIRKIPVRTFMRYIVPVKNCHGHSCLLIAIRYHEVQGKKIEKQEMLYQHFVPEMMNCNSFL
ncbi:MAG: hypothetical protein MI743_05550 [Sneathiellales bacterium]|nr:hypothetical protein [Sneathiellales bacterium]